jgi:hypothetical protein
VAGIIDFHGNNHVSQFASQQSDLLSDLPARSAFADTVPAFVAVPVDVACGIAIPTFDMPALGAGECASIELLHVGIDASALRTNLSGRESR